MSDDFEQTAATVHSADHLAIRAAAGAWIALAAAARQGQDHLSGAARRTGQERGEGLAELAGRLQGLSSWGGGAADVALAIGRQLQTAGDATAVASERLIGLEVEYEKSKKQQQGAESDAGVTRGEEDRQRLADEARKVLRELDAQYGRVSGADAPTAPEVGAAAGGTDAGTGTVSARGTSGVAPAGSGSGTYATAPNGTAVAPGSYPHAAVAGPEAGDFAGWVTSPSTGFLVDPATGREFDPASGRWIDPVTGRPFGAVTEYATRLAGLGAGPGELAVGTGVALAATGSGTVQGGGLGGLYGGVVPPSVSGAGPVSGQVSRQALSNLAHRAEVANRFAQREATLGGRPYLPPPGAGYGGGAVRGSAPPQRGGPGHPARTPLPGGGGAFRADGAHRADALARHGLTPAPARQLPPPAPGPPARGTGAGAGRSAGQHGSPPLTEDPAVWSGPREAPHDALGALVTDKPGDGTDTGTATRRSHTEERSP